MPSDNDVLAALVYLTDLHRIPPTMAETAAYLGTPKSNVHRHILRLAATGRVVHVPRIARGTYDITTSEADP